jgi:hypothetical protein
LESKGFGKNQKTRNACDRSVRHYNREVHGTKAELRFALSTKHRQVAKLTDLHAEIRKVLVDRKGV